jgi:membrane protein YqaA with SNARE-associated domain
MTPRPHDPSGTTFLDFQLLFLVNPVPAQKSPPKIGLTDARMSAIERIFARYGSATVLFARFFSILRQLNGIVAGTLGMSWWRMIQNEKGRETAK